MRWKESDFWKHSSPREIINFLEALTHDKGLADWVLHMDEDPAFADMVFEYLWICRSDTKVVEILNSSEFSPMLLLHFIYFGFGKQLSVGNVDAVAYFLQIKDMLTSEQSLRLLALSTEMDQDPTLKIHLLANLDPQTWEAYFEILEQNSQTMQTLLEIFVNLRVNEIRKILLNSPTLYYYLRMMLFSSSLNGVENKIDQIDLKEILESIKVWEMFCQKIATEFSMKKERELSPRERNSQRLSVILRELLQIPAADRVDILIYIKASGALIDEVEESTILSLLQNHDTRGSFI
ncbi:hypothetical protein EHQ58_18255 [Leptospira ognonensis]|uniref:Uncharacterized protein n=1 Tax=Leptospira ognonensis TaxID=2484945 RepID=A0A4R9JUE2_9LEPT|nr:hypothetical protein [Leptospira ognonensis]TGL55870.1 hypothetical protein EHQ58_18255 [Leptospira ognonensis]